ncbi:multicopper oxidase family protein [Brevibacillus fortis]|uniref:Copper oxidase n=1 Tax=Brevibacillus fortis TaxID=2126352 RepID=A0A2P7VH60_9BACL|nr:multicopper oxidase family protein [Brevibacillus fortis]PSJ98568.1 copper oxidase [Brevibacillus fortis]
MADFEVLAGIHQGLFLVLLIVMLLPTMMANQLVFLPTKRAFISSARITLCFSWSALFVLAGHLVMTWVLFESFGWLYIKDKLLGFLPFIFVPLLCCLLSTFPRLWELAGKGSRESRQSLVDTEYTRILLHVKNVRHAKAISTNLDDTLDAESRGDASCPELLVPLQASVLGCLIALFLQVFFPAVTLEPSILFLAWGVFLAGVSLLWIRQSWKHQYHSTAENWVKPRRLHRFIRFAAFLLMTAFIATIWGNQAMVASRLSDHSPLRDQNQDDHALPDFVFPVTASAQSMPSTGILGSVDEPTKPNKGKPDRTFSLSAQKTSVRQVSGKTVEAWTLNGQYPGPELRMKQGELVEIILMNKDISEGIDIHWHGMQTPASDNRIAKGEKSVYRFRAEQTGTYWYHSHQQIPGQVVNGLFGALVIEPSEATATGAPIRDIAMIHHKDDKAGATLNGSHTRINETIAPGTTVRLRFINAENAPVSYLLQGTPFQVVAIDGTEVNEPNLIANQAMQPGAGGRYDIQFTMPNRPVLFAPAANQHDKGLLLSPDGSEDAVPFIDAELSVFDPARYGSPIATPFDLSSHFDREYQLLIDGQYGFYNGQFERLSTVNGDLLPDTRMILEEGDLIKLTFVNRSFKDQSIYLHGHHMLILSRDGKKVTGSPWWTDTLQIAPGETYEVAFRANNPGASMEESLPKGETAFGMAIPLVYEEQQQ